jgi:hypothetical protein
MKKCVRGLKFFFFKFIILLIFDLKMVNFFARENLARV